MNRGAVLRRFALFFLVVLAGCSSGFEREWRIAAVRPERDPFAGRWEGQWRSEKHRNAGGRLRCIMIPNGLSRYQAKFKADWMIFSSSYSTIFDVQRKRNGKEISFRGSENLGPLFGGVYKFEGAATPLHFHAAYDSSYDTGTFEMGRPVR